MKTLKITGQFKKDLKRYKHQADKIDALEEILKKLRAGEEIPSDFNPHPLTGNYKGHMECHFFWIYGIIDVNLQRSRHKAAAHSPQSGQRTGREGNRHTKAFIQTLSSGTGTSQTLNLRKIVQR